MERKINAAMEKDNCQSRNEFLEKALKFYCDYLAAEEVSEFLPPVGNPVSYTHLTLPTT